MTIWPYGIGLALLAFLTGCGSLQRKVLFYPTHHSDENGLAQWKVEGQHIGYSREVSTPKNVWLLLHGNGGQASDRTYAIPCFSSEDSVFILEYPGYGKRPGKPSSKALNRAAFQSYTWLRQHFTKVPVCVAGESIGTGPACVLTQLPQPPDKLVLIVPFDSISSVASDHVSWLPAGMLLGRTWNNIKSLQNYQGPIDLFGAEADTVIPLRHAQRLAQSKPSAKLYIVPGGHNEWSTSGKVSIRKP
jgi:pimeloyl-ACP methyl ester carboxylesterase